MNEKDYFESWSNELCNKANQIRMLIGDAHWLTDGHHKEVIIRRFLKAYIPKQITIGSGFIKNHQTGKCSKELDVFLTNPTLHPPFLNEGGIQIAPPSSTAAYIEVKSSFSSANLRSSLENISAAQNVLGSHRQKVWRGVIFASVDRTLDSFCSTIEDELNKLFNVSKITKAEQLIEILPTAIASFQNHTVFFRADNEKNEIVLKGFEFKKLSLAITFSDLFDHLRALDGINQRGELSELVEQFTPCNLKKIRLKVLEHG